MRNTVLTQKLFAALVFLLPAFAAHAATVTLFSTNQTWRYATGLSEASTPISAWRSNTFNDASFADSPAPFWYDTQATPDTSTRVGGNHISGMQNAYLCIFLRKQFLLTNSPYLTNLQLNACVDDGFVAWINGYEVLRVNPPPEPFTISSSVAVASPEPVVFTSYNLPPPGAYLDPSGTNVLTVQVFNAGLASTDVDFDTELLAMTATPVNVLAPGNPIAGVAATPGSSASAVAVVGTAAGVNNYPAAENPPSSIDANTGTKYLNFARINCGFIVTIPNNIAKVNGFQFTTANDTPDRDPTTVTLEGTSAPDPTTAAAGSTWVQIYSGPSGLATDPGRFLPGAAITFLNSSSFNTYRMLITDTRVASANSMQFSEIQFQGQFALDGIAPTVTNFLPTAATLESPVTSLTVQFSEAVSGVNASDLLLNGTPATGVTGSGANYVFTFPALPLGTTTVSFASSPGIADFAAPPNLFDPANVTRQYNIVDTTAPVIASYLPLPNSFVRTLTRVEVQFSEPVTGVDSGDLLINTVPATGLELGGPGQYAFTFPQPATGVVQVAWAAGHGIKDVTTNNFAGGSWIYTLDPNAVFDVRLNEFMTDNQNGIRDEDGGHEDWIELYNSGTTPVNLDGWFLTDEALNLHKWRFPAGVQMLANSYLLVWASAKDRPNIGALHTNFKLAKEGSFLALVQPDSNSVVSAFAPYPAQRTDASYGRDRLDPSILGFYDVPTPRAPNSVGGPSGFASDVKYSVSSGTFVAPFNLTLSTTSTNAVIRYVIITNYTQATAALTNVPTASSPAYTGAIPITVTTEIRARAFETGLFPGTPVTESYVQINNDVRNFSSDIPVVVVHMLGKPSINLSTTTDSAILMAFDTEFGRSSLTNVPQTASRMGLHARGSSTINNAKTNIRLETWDEFNQDAKHPLLGMPADSDWVLYGINGFDPGLMHNAIYQWLGRSLGVFNMRTRYVEVFNKVNSTGPLTTNDYFGLYLLLETPKVSNDRVDIASLHNEDTNAPAITGGYIMKIDRLDNERSFTPPTIGSIRPTPAPVVFTDPPYLASEADPRRLKQIAYAQTYILSFITNLSTVGYTNSVTGYAQYINPDQWVNHLLANIIPFNVDGYRLSGFIYKDRNGRLEQGPMWDCDRCMGTGGVGGSTPQADNRCFNPRYWRLPASDVNTDNGTDFFGVSNVGVSWFTPLFRDPDFWQRFIDRYQNVRTNEYSSNSIVAMLDGYYKNIKEAQAREQARWAPSGFTYPRFGSQTINGYTFDFGPSDNAGRGRFTNEVNFQKKWFLDRFEFMDTNFLAMPTLSQGTTPVTTGTTVTVTPAAKANTRLLYTLDGTDPRLPGGAVSPNALTNVGALTLTISNNVRLFARSYNTSHANMTNSGAEVGKPLINSYWSGPVAGTYYTTLPPLRITELMYHPANPPAGNTNDPDNFEYIEVKNISGGSLNVSGFRIRGGVDFDFPNITLAAGQAAVVVKHVAAFQSRYGVAPLILGSYSNNLANDGDHLVLQGALREPILDFEFKDSWYTITDGAGFSLQIVDDNLAPTNWGLKASWRPSGSYNGSPGSNDAGATSFATIYVNEALTHTVPPQADAIELCNPTGGDVNIGGWFLTDNFNVPKRYRIPNNTIVPANGYYVFYANAPTSFSNAFLLSSSGDALYLFSGDANTNLTGYVHGFDFGPQATNVTFGRYVVSSGNDHFPAQMSSTLGSANAGPKVGPIVVSEIMYHPPDVATTEGPRDNTRDEYIELANISSALQPLYDTNNPANTWRLRDAVSFTFPTNQFVSIGERILIVSFDPLADPQATLRFRAANQVDSLARLFGPYDGQLDNSGDSIELVRPDAPVPPGEPDAGAVYYILVDKVNYSDLPPWPELADGSGDSLQRIVPGSYGNDATNWVSTFPTPGASETGQGVPVFTMQPQSVAVLGGQPTSFSVTVTGAPPITYQWRFNNGDIAGATATTYTIPSVTPAHAGNYRCVARNGGGGVQSSNATLSYVIPPNITQQPTNLFLRLPPDPLATNRFAVFRVTATTANPPLSYRWRVNGTNLPVNDPNITGVTTSTLSLTNVTFDNAGYYSCAVTDGNGPITSADAVLGAIPFLTHFCSPVTVAAGADISLEAVVQAFPPPFLFSWRRSTPVNTNIVTSNGMNFATFNSTVAGYTLAPGVLSNSFVIRLVFTNLATTASGILATQNNTFITVLADSDADGMPDVYELNYSGSTNSFVPGDDADGDGMTNLAEFLAGTDPSDPGSYLRVDLTITNMPTVRFGAISNRTYSVQYTDVLTNGLPPAMPPARWSTLADVLSQPTNRIEFFPDPLRPNNRFYRVVTPSQQPRQP